MTETAKSRLTLGLIVVSYPLLILLFMPGFFGMPMDTETVTRFITPYMFNGSNTIPWTVMESTQWSIFRPVFSLSVLFDYTLWGNSEVMYHVTDLVLSWAAFILAFVLFRKRLGLPVTLIALALWTLGPWQFFSMMKIVGRNDRLVTLFTLSALFFFDRAQDRNGTKRTCLLALSFVSVVTAVLSKETGLLYSALLPLWGLLVLREPLKELVKRNILLWAAIAAACMGFFVLRHLADFSMSIDSGGMNTGTDYMKGFAVLVLWSMPVLDRLHPDLLTVFFLVAGTALGTLVIPRLPRASRFGAAGFLLFIFPFPLFWIQRTFLWGFSLWSSLWLAGLVAPIAVRAGRSGSRLVRIAWAVPFVAALVFLGYTSGNEGNESAEWSLKLSAFADDLLESGPGPGYTPEQAESVSPEVWYTLGTMGPRERCKIMFYIEELMRIRSGDPGVTITLED